MTGAQFFKGAQHPERQQKAEYSYVKQIERGVLPGIWKVLNTFASPLMIEYFRNNILKIHQLKLIY